MEDEVQVPLYESSIDHLALLGSGDLFNDDVLLQNEHEL